MDLIVNSAFAQSAVTNVATLMAKINKFLINPLILLIFALAFAYFIWGVIQFIAGSTNEEKRTTGKSHIMWGLVGMLIMVGVFFIMKIIIDTLGVKGIVPQGGEVKVD